MNLTHRDRYNFTVGQIKFIVVREANPDWKMDKMIQPAHHILVLARSGHARYETPRGEFSVGAGEVLFFRRGETRAAAASKQDPWSFITVAFELIPLDEGTGEDIDAIPTVNAVRDLPAYTALFEELVASWDLRDDGALLKCRALIAELLCRLIREARQADAPSAHREKIEYVKGLIAEGDERADSTEQLAELVGLSHSHFRALFKEETGETVLQFRNRLKIARASALLQSGVCNVTEAAYETGFSDVYYFSRLFKKITGKSPSYHLRRG